MKYEILYKDSYPLVKCFLEQGEKLKAVSGSMVCMSSSIDVDGDTAKCDFVQGVKRAHSKDYFLWQYMTAARGNGEAVFAPSLPGCVEVVKLERNTCVNLFKNNFLACEYGLEAVSKPISEFHKFLPQELSGIFQVSGTGCLFISAFGSLHKIDINEGEEYFIDIEHLIAWTDSPMIEIGKVSDNWISSISSGESFVCRIAGPCSVYLQTLNFKRFQERFIFPAIGK